MVLERHIYPRLTLDPDSRHKHIKARLNINTIKDCFALVPDLMHVYEHMLLDLYLSYESLIDHDLMKIDNKRELNCNSGCVQVGNISYLCFA